MILLITYRPRRFVLILTAAAIAAAFSPGAGAQAPAKEKPAAAAKEKSGSAEGKGSGDAKNGKKLYVSYGCYQCHNRAGQGSTMTGPRLGPAPIEFTAFVAYVRHPSAEMPPYTSKIVTDAELADIYAFLESLPQPAAVKNIPLLNDSPK